MLQIVAMALVDLSSAGLLDPYDLVDEPVTVVFEHIQGELVLIVDDPYEEETLSLDQAQGQRLDPLICQG